MLKRFSALKPDPESAEDTAFAAAMAAFSAAYAGRIDELTDRLQDLADQATQETKGGKAFSWGRALFEQVIIKSAEAIASGSTSLK